MWKRSSNIVNEPAFSASDPVIRLGPLELDPIEATQHFLVVGATGSGKTTILRLLLQDVIPTLSHAHHKQYESTSHGERSRMLIYDPKQDMIPIIRGICPGANLIVTHPFDRRGAAWDIATDVTEPRVALEIAYTLIPHAHNESQPFFTNAARHLIYGVMLNFLARGLSWTFGDLMRAVQSPGNLRRILKASGLTANLISRYFFDKRLLSNIMSSIATHMLPFESIAAAWETATERFSLEQWVNSSDILILGSSDTSKTPLDTINRCLFKRASDIILGKPDLDFDHDEDFPPLSFFILDEVSELGQLDGLVALCKKGRSKGVSVAVAFQSIEGMRDQKVLGPSATAEILGQMGHRFFGRLECPETAEWASKLFGDQEVHQYTTSYTSGQQSSSTSNEQIVRHAAVMPSEFLSLIPCSEHRGLSAYYLSRVTGAFFAHIDGIELFNKFLVPKNSDDGFTSRPPEAQLLAPWTPELEQRFAPAKKRKMSPPQSRRPGIEPGDFSALE